MFKTSALAELAKCQYACKVGVTLKITNRGTHRETMAPYAVTAAGGPARSYSSACSGNAATWSRDRDLDPGETVVIKGCTVTYKTRGSYSHCVVVDHGVGSARYYDDKLWNNGATAATRVK